MARATDDHQFTLGPSLGEFPRRDERTAQVKASMDQDAGKVCERTRMSHQHPRFKPGVVTTIVGHETRTCQLQCGLQAPWVRCGLGGHRHQGGLPRAPSLGRLHGQGRIGILQKAVVRRDEIAIAVSRWDTGAEARPLCREQGGHATIQPVDLGSPGGGDAAEHHFRDASRMALGVREPKGRAPRTAKQPPGVKIQVLAKRLQVRQEMCRRLDRQIGAQVTGVQRPPATPSLVEQHDPVGLRSEVATSSCRTT